MKISLLQIGPTVSAELKTLCADYENRLKKYTRFEVVTIPTVKNATALPVQELKKKEWALFSQKIAEGAVVVLLDEKGKEYTSEGFAGLVSRQQVSAVKEVVFIIGGAFGFDEQAYKTAAFKMALSQMTFSHQMVRLIFLEQLYRAFTIVKGEKYHHI